MYEAWLEFPEGLGGGGLKKNPFHKGGGMHNFWNWCTHYNVKKNVFVSQVENAIIHCFIGNSYITQFKHSYFKTSSSLAVRWGRFSPVLLPGVDSPLELRERPWTLWITEDDPGVAALLCLMFKIPFIASALRFKNNNTNCYFLQKYKLKNWAEFQNSDEEG